MSTMTIRTYTRLCRYKTFDERFEYLKLVGRVGKDVFGEDRPINQAFYQSPIWKEVRNEVIVRDRGLDLGCDGYEIADLAVVHHMNPVTLEDLEDFHPRVLDPEYLITVSQGTHLAIHYGDPNQLPRLSTERRPGDTRLW